MEQQNCLEDIMWSENPLWGGTNLFGVKNSVETFREIRTSLTQQTKQKTTQKPAMTLGLWKGISFIVITSNLEFNSACRKSKHSQSRWNLLMWPGLRTQNLDVMQESRIDDYWTVDVDRNLSDSWTGFTKFTILKKKKKNAKRICVVRGAPYNNSRNFQTWLYCGLKFWSRMSKAAQKKGKQQWAIEKPKLDDARRLRGIYFIDPEDGEFKETIENAGKKLEILMESAMPCKMRAKKRSNKSRVTDDESEGSNKNPKDKACTHRRGFWIHVKAFGIDSTKRSWRSYRRERVQFDESWQSCAQNWFRGPKQWTSWMRKQQMG